MCNEDFIKLEHEQFIESQIKTGTLEKNSIIKAIACFLWKSDRKHSIFMTNAIALGIC